jgi:hypothetical protein
MDGVTNRTNDQQDPRPKSVELNSPFRLSYLILQSGECVVGTTGESFGAFSSAAGAAWWLRRFADAIERDGEAHKTALDGVAK